MPEKQLTKTKRRKQNGGRPTKMTVITVNKLKDAFSWGATDLEACAFAEISTPVLYQYQKDHPDFLAKKEQLKSMTGLHARRNISKDVQEGSVHTAKWYAERRIEEFNPKKLIQVEHDHKLSIDSNLLDEYHRLTKSIQHDESISAIDAEVIEITEETDVTP